MKYFWSLSLLLLLNDDDDDAVSIFTSAVAIAAVTVVVSAASTSIRSILSPSLWINVGRGLVHDDDPAPPEHCSGQADQLPLPHAQVGAALAHLRLKAQGKGADDAVQAGLGTVFRRRTINYKF